MKTQQIPTLEQAFTGTLLGSIKPEEQIVELDPSELQEITQQPFRVYKSDKLSDLADSIRENGQQQPCIVRKKMENTLFFLAATVSEPVKCSAVKSNAL